MNPDRVQSKRRERAPRAFRAASLGSLSKTQRTVLGWVEQGKRDAEIAVILGRSERTIHSHVAAILMKLGVETRGAASSALRAAQPHPCPTCGVHRPAAPAP